MQKKPSDHIEHEVDRATTRAKARGIVIGFDKISKSLAKAKQTFFGGLFDEPSDKEANNDHSP